MSRLVCLLLIVYWVFPGAHAAKAVQEFNTRYDSTYTILQNGTTEVTHQIVIKNNLSQIFPRDYTLAITGNTLDQIAAYDDKGKTLPMDKTLGDNSTNLKISLNTPNIGQNQENTINLRYVTQDIVIHNNHAWEINIPRLKQGGEMASVKRTIIFPTILGAPTSAVPKPDAIQSNGETTSISYTSSQNETISLLFGVSQWYQLDLTYHLDAPLAKGSYTEISLPPDTAYQQVILSSIDPKPSSITVDQDGNWLARYPYQENFNPTVQVKLYTEISPLPIYKDPSSTNASSYLSSSDYWPTNSPLVKRTSEQLKTPKNIYDYLLATFNYNNARVAPGATRLGGAKALESPSLAICTEFADTFVTLSRTIGVASREINGYAVSSNQELRPLSQNTDILHAWAEYYDSGSKIWRQVDPTWGKTTGGLDYFTKLDYSHITFVRHGVESNYPFPAGAYKKSIEDKTLEIKLADNPEKPEQKYELSEKKGSYTIQNTGNVALIDYPIILPDRTSHVIGYLPPYGSLKLEDVLGAKTSPLSKLWSIITSFLCKNFCTK